MSLGMGLGGYFAFTRLAPPYAEHVLRMPGIADDEPAVLAWSQSRPASTLTAAPMRDFVGAVSVGVVDGEVLLDLNYEEDSRADVDMNFVMTAGNKIVELQATAEHQVFDDAQLTKMISLARQGIQSLIAKQRAFLGTLSLRQ